MSSSEKTWQERDGNKVMVEAHHRIGLIAGTGLLPYLFLKAAALKGFEPVILALDKNWKIPSEFPKNSVHFIPPTSAQAILDTLRAENISEITFLGKIDKEILFQNPDFDARARQILGRIQNWSDGTLMSAIIEELEKEGFHVKDQTLLLRGLFPSVGVLTRRQPNQREWLDIKYGFKLAKGIADLDIGQTIVVKNSAPLAVEAIEGTDEAIRRGCGLSDGRAVVIKVSRPDQDNRFDVPAVGPDTLRAMIEGQAAVLAIEADRTLLIERNRVIALADEHNISILAYAE